MRVVGGGGWELTVVLFFCLYFQDIVNTVVSLLQDISNKIFSEMCP